MIASTLKMDIHCDSFYSLPIEMENYTRTIWARDAYGLPTYTNLYGAHPVFINQITGENPSAYGVFLLNSNGMDVKFPESGRYLEYNVLGGILDLYFFAGPTPAEASKQYVQAIGKSRVLNPGYPTNHLRIAIGFPAEVPYWSLGFHQCRSVRFTRSRQLGTPADRPCNSLNRYGTNDIVEAAETVANVS